MPSADFETSTGFFKEPNLLERNHESQTTLFSINYILIIINGTNVYVQSKQLLKTAVQEYLNGSWVNLVERLRSSHI